VRVNAIKYFKFKLDCPDRFRADLTQEPDVPCRCHRCLLAFFIFLPALLILCGAGVQQPAAPPLPTQTPAPGSLITNSLGMTFAYIPDGTFMMGSPLEEPGRREDETRHEVTISRPFYMQTTEVTQAQWRRVMGRNPSFFKNCGQDCPVENVSWGEVQEFIKRLNALEKTNKYRLPTEAEWEYACRAGTDTPFYSGPVIILGDNTVPALDVIAWHAGNSCADYPGALDLPIWWESQPNCSRFGPQPAARKLPNAWGLFDMSGNVWEWCQNWYKEYSEDPAVDPQGPDYGSERVFRGGSWISGGWDCRSASRDGFSPGGRGLNIGFRLVRRP